MNIPVIINNERVFIEADPAEQVSSVLERQGFSSVKIDNNAAILLDDVIVQADNLPFAALWNRNIVTLEYFMKTDDYADIEQGLKKTGVSLCGFCDSAKIFAAYDILRSENRQKKEDIFQIMSMYTCPCTNIETITNAIIQADVFRRQRLRIKKYE